MKEIIQTLRGTMLFDDNIFKGLKESPDVFRKGFIFLLVVGLLAGGANSLVNLVQGLITNPAAQMTQDLAEMESTMKQFMPQGGADTEVMLANIRAGFQVGQRIETETSAPLPRFFELLFQQVGAAVSYPLAWIGSLMLYGALAHIFAKLMGGKAKIAQMYGLTCLATAPQLITALNFIPCLGSLLWLIATVWGWFIYIKAVIVAQDLTVEKGVTAALLPAVLFFVLGLTGVGLLVVLIGISG